MDGKLEKPKRSTRSFCRSKLCKGKELRSRSWWPEWSDAAELLPLTEALWWDASFAIRATEIPTGNKPTAVTGGV